MNKTWTISPASVTEISPTGEHVHDSPQKTYTSDSQREQGSMGKCCRLHFPLESKSLAVWGETQKYNTKVLSGSGCNKLP